MRSKWEATISTVVLSYELVAGSRDRFVSVIKKVRKFRSYRREWHPRNLGQEPVCIFGHPDVVDAGLCDRSGKS